VKLLNGNLAPRVRNSEGCTVLDCGCAHDSIRWLQMCDADWADYEGRHLRSQADHDREAIREMTS
jgi:hypothetical protein